MSKRKSKRHQKMYKMKGCSKTRKNKRHLGGSNFAYTGHQVVTVKNPFLAYTAKGGNNLAKTYPNTGPVNIGQLGVPFLNPVGNQRGGCGCGLPSMSGGCGPLCAAGIISGGKKHRHGCKCVLCKRKRSSQSGGQPYANGSAGSPWTSSSSNWPGVDGIQGNNNHYPINNNVQATPILTGAQPPFSVGGKRNKKQRGGTLSNFIGQDLINLGRQVQFGVGSAYNSLAGYASPVSPLPWKGQLANTPNLSTIKSVSV